MLTLERGERGGRGGDRVGLARCPGRSTRASTNSPEIRANNNNRNLTRGSGPHARPIRRTGKGKRNKTPSTTSRRIVTTFSIGISRRRREDWLILRAAKQMSEGGQRDEGRTAKSRREVCRILVNSNHRECYFQ